MQIGGSNPQTLHLLAGFFVLSITLLGNDPTHLFLPLSLAPPSASAAQSGVAYEKLAIKEYEKLAQVRGLLQNQKYAAADAILTRSLALWQKSDQPPGEIATILKDRANARQASPQRALEDLDAALKLYAQMSADDQPLDEVVGAMFLRGQVQQRLSHLVAAEMDFSAALDLDDTNPFLWSARGDNRGLQGKWSGAAEDYLAAEKSFKLIGDKIRRTLSAADASIALYGSGDKTAAFLKMAQVGKQARSDVASNDPENIPRLQELARKEAELHLVRAGVSWGEGKKTEAAEDWARGCIRLEGYTLDAVNRNTLRADKQDDEARRAMTGPNSKDKAEDALAGLLGMTPDSNYVKDRESDKPLWNQFVPGKATSFDPKAAVPEHLDEFVGCRPFYDTAWVKANRVWPSEIQVILLLF